MRAAVVVAHPDDELVFAGSLVLSTDATWSLVSLTGALGPWSYAFYLAAEGLDERGVKVESVVILDVPDLGLIWTAGEFHAVGRYVEELPDFDLVVTHNRRGDYGHPHHVGTSYAVRCRYPHAWEFYYPGPTGVGPQARQRSQLSVPVDPRKRELCHEAYGERFEALEANRPDLVRHYFDTGPEVFTR